MFVLLVNGSKNPVFSSGIELEMYEYKAMGIANTPRRTLAIVFYYL